jgi:hypothetical protein
MLLGKRSGTLLILNFKINIESFEHDASSVNLKLIVWSSSVL